MTGRKRGAGWFVVVSGVLLVSGFVAGQSVSGPGSRHAHQTTEPRRHGAEQVSTAAQHAAPLAPPTTFQEGPGLRAAARLDRTAVLKGTDGKLFVELSLEAMGDADHKRPTDFIVVLDHSGSMDGQKLAYAKTATRRLIDQLASQDRFALVTYDSNAELTFGLAQATDEHRLNWQRGLARVSSGTGTNISAGLDLALAQLARHRDPERVQRVLLLSDGLANEGDSSHAGLSRRARHVASLGAGLTSMGIGDDFDQALMTQLAEAGTGNFYYLARLEALGGFFEAELHAASRTVASNLTVHFVPGAFAQLDDAAGYPLERSAGEIVFAPGSLFAGQRRSLWLKLSVPTTEMTALHLGALRVSYTHRGERHAIPLNALPEVACVSEARVFEQQIVRDVWEAAIAREELAKVQDRLADAVAHGTGADVDRVVHEYVIANESLANNLDSKVVRESVLEVRRRATEAKAVQARPAPLRNVESRHMKASGSFWRREDAYSADPYSGL